MTTGNEDSFLYMNPSKLINPFKNKSNSKLSKEYKILSYGELELEAEESLRTNPKIGPFHITIRTELNEHSLLPLMKIKHTSTMRTLRQ